MRTDPDLLRDIDEAGSEKRPVQAVFFLRSDVTERPPEAEQTRAAVQRLLREVERETAERPRGVNVFPNLGSFALEASPRFVRAILGHDEEIESARSNRARSSPIISPRKRRAPE